MINKDQISEKLGCLSIDQIAGAHDFSLRQGSKIDAYNFILSFFVMLHKGQHSLGCWAKELCLLIKCTLSANGLKAALNERRQNFAKALLEQAVKSQLSSPKAIRLSCALFVSFKRVFLEDSTCVKLPKNLFKYFPGSHSSNGKAATAKIHLRTELKSGQHVQMDLQCFRDNDQKYAPNILHSLRPNDLIIRDLGYWALWVLRLIEWMEAFFISRWKYGTYVYDPESLQKIDLAKLLRKARRHQQSVVELNVLLGKTAQLSVRLCAIKASPKVVRKRREKAKKNRQAAPTGCSGIKESITLRSIWKC